MYKTGKKVRAIGAALVTAGVDRVETIQMDAAQAPGVSAAGVGGMDIGRWLQAAKACGERETCHSFDVVELNPRFDVDGRTATLAALTVWHLLSGIAGRD